MLQKAVARASVRCAKYAFSGREDIDWDRFIRGDLPGARVDREPFPHIVIDDFFSPEAYAELCDRFRNVRERGVTEDIRDTGRFHPFDMDYDGHVFIPVATLEPLDPLSIFFSIDWNMRLSKLFGQFTSFETSLAFHHHPPGNRTGFIHHDFTDKRFNSRPRLHNGVIPYGMPDNGGEYARRRIIAVIFFLENDHWQEGDGGETGLYAADKTTLVKKISPINNRLFAFHIGTHSYHAFQNNLQERNSIIQWLHVPAELL